MRIRTSSRRRGPTATAGRVGVVVPRGGPGPGAAAAAGRRPGGERRGRVRGGGGRRRRRVGDRGALGRRRLARREQATEAAARARGRPEPFELDERRPRARLAAEERRDQAARLGGRRGAAAASSSWWCEGPELFGALDDDGAGVVACRRRRRRRLPASAFSIFWRPCCSSDCAVAEPLCPVSPLMIVGMASTRELKKPDDGFAAVGERGQHGRGEAAGVVGREAPADAGQPVAQEARRCRRRSRRAPAAG